VNGDFLQYGALGALVLVLGGIGLFLRSYMTKEQERQDERDREDRLDRRSLTSSFQELVAQDIEAKQMLKASLDGMCAEMRANQDGTAVVLAELVEGQRAHDERAAERHRQSMEMGREIVAQLRHLNGKA
jgi:hypothetical protein